MSDFVILGTRDVWGEEEPFALFGPDRRHHLYTIGKSGAGKTTMLRNLILQDIEAGRGVGVIDPHGDLADDLLDHIPRHRIEEVAYFNPADTESLIITANTSSLTVKTKDGREVTWKSTR